MISALLSFPKPRRFPLSRKHRPIRPAMRSVLHHATLESFSTIAAGRMIRTTPIGLTRPPMIPYSLDSIAQWLVVKYKAENVQVTAHLQTDHQDPNIDCSWTSKPRLGQKNRAYLAAHGIKV